MKKILVILFVLCSLIVNAQYPTYTVSVPNPAPTPPGDVFTPTMSGNAASNTPVIAEWNRTAGADESILFTGVNLSGLRVVTYTQSGGYLDAKIQRLDAEKAIITLPAGTGMRLIWPENGNGYGAPIAINRTEAWWLGPQIAFKGETTSVFGRNLSRNNDTLVSHVLIKPAVGAGQWATVTRVNPYKVDFTVPAGLADGNYEVWVHNSHGGNLGWSGPLTLTVQTRTPWNGTVFNVQTYGATGDGVTDDRAAIQAAINAATPNSTVFFPAGTYNVGNTVSLRSDIRYMGVGDASEIRCAPTFDANAFGLIIGQNGVNNIEISNLSLNGNNNYRGNFNSPVYLRANQNMTIRNVRFAFAGYDLFDFQNSSRIFVDQCRFIGKIGFLGNASQVFIDSCDFKQTNDTELSLHSWGGVGVSLTNSAASDLDGTSTGQGKGRFFVGNGAFGSAWHAYLGYNTTTNLGVRNAGGVDQNSGEQFMWEGNFTFWSGTPSSATSTTVVCPGVPVVSDARYVAIVRGRGIGQVRRITGYSGSTVTIAEPWNVIPDGTSVVNIGRYVDKVAIYKNALDGKVAQVTDNVNQTAQSGIQPFGGAFNFIADANVINEVRDGISNWSTRVPEGVGVDPNFFNVYVNNIISGCRWAISNQDGRWNTNIDSTRTAILGTVYRNNTIQNPFLIAIRNQLNTVTYPVIDGMIYEQNTVTNAPTVFSSPINGTANHLFYRNNFALGAPWEVVYKLPITTQSEIVDMNAQSNVRLSRLFDGVFNQSLKDGVGQSFPRISETNPFDSRIFLDSIYNISSLRYRVGAAGLNPNQGHKILMYDANRNLIGDTIEPGYSGFDQWVTFNFSPRANVRYIRFYYDNWPTMENYLQNNYSEIEFFGTAVSVAPAIRPAFQATVAPDFGVRGYGVNGISDLIGDRVLGNLSDSIYKRYYSYRLFHTGWEWDAVDGVNDLSTMSLNLGRYGTDYTANRLVGFKANNLPVMVNHSGTSIQRTVNPSNGGFLADTAYKWINRWTTGSAAADFRWLGRKIGMTAALYASNPNAQLDNSKVINGATTKGRSLINIFETENEPNRDWAGAEPYYHTPQQFYWSTRTVSDSIASKDGTASIYAGALTSIDTMYWKAAYYSHWEETGNTNALPNVSAFNFNTYINDALAQRGGTIGWSGEQWNLYGKLLAAQSFMRRYYPGKFLNWTEHGYATNEDSPYDVPTIAGVTHERTQVNWTLRNVAITQAVPIMGRFYYYKQSNDFTFIFGTMALTIDTLNAQSVYLGTRVKPIGYAYAQNGYIERDYQWKSTVIATGDSTSVWVTKKNHSTDNDKKLYKVWRGTRNNSTTSNYILDLGSATGTAKIFTNRLDRWEPDSTTLTITNNSVTIPSVTEGITWVEVTETSNTPPTANAGPDRSVTLPTTTTTLNGSGSDQQGSVTFAWSKLSGPAGGAITSPTSATTGITGLQEGTYVYRLTVTDAGNLTTTDDVTVTVNPAGSSIWVKSVSRVFLQRPSRLSVTIFYVDNTRQVVSVKPVSISLQSVWVRSSMLGGQLRPVAILKFADGTFVTIEKKGDF